MLRTVALIRTNVSEERSASIIRVTRIGEIGLLVTANVVPNSPFLVTLMIQVTTFFRIVTFYESHTA
jgi:hypothetical protein